MTQTDYSRSRLTLRFRDPRVERAFVEVHSDETVGPVRIGLWALFALTLPLLFMAWAAPKDVPNGELIPFFRWFFIAQLGGAAATLWLSYRPQFRRLGQGAIALLIALCLTPLAVIVVSNRDPATISLLTFGWSIVIFFAFTVARLRFSYATLLTAAAGAAFVIAAFVANPLDYGRHGLAFFYLASVYVIGAIACRTSERRARDTFVARRLLEAEKAESERLLLNVLPPAIAERLKRGEEVIADGLDQVTILFSDIVGFTQLSARLEPEALVQLLNGVFTAFDELADRLGLEKIKTIGDAYMVAAGLPEPRADHAEAIARMALAMRDAVDRWARQVGDGLSVRIGIHTGSVIAGVIGKRKFVYDMWGDTVNTASRMESHGIAGNIQVTAATYALLKDRFTFEERGEIEVKGKGPMQTYLLREERTTPSK